MIQARRSCVVSAVIVVVGLLDSTTPVKAQESIPAQRPKMSVEQVFRQWDRNSDGKLTPDEAPDEFPLKVLDRNADGFVARGAAKNVAVIAAGIHRKGRQGYSPRARRRGAIAAYVRRGASGSRRPEAHRLARHRAFAFFGRGGPRILFLRLRRRRRPQPQHRWIYQGILKEKP